MLNSAGCLRNPTFDFLFIIGIFIVAIFSAALVLLKPNLFLLVFSLDLWLLGYHHVIATYTRFLDKATWGEHSKLVIYLPWAVVGVVGITTKIAGVWLIATVYLYWQFFHYLRQSEGISKAFLAKCARPAAARQTFQRLIFYGIPVVAFLNLTTKNISEFLWLPVYVPSLPISLLALFNGVAFVAFVYSVLGNVNAYRRGDLSLSYLLYVVSHYIIFVVAYALIDEINIGWLAINIWHNFQYIVFVWLFNTNRFKNGLDKSNLFLSYFSQPQRFIQYFFVFFIITTFTYKGLGYITDILDSYTIIPLIVVIYQTLNFHHYIVDTFIWKLRKPAIRERLLAG